ncbi:hypothetical protein SAMN05216388_1004197 [Halorientalis persicus]|jgi:hypothetical protein|uniref:Uncharacterized protein n=1 Tax=Halorientalis persicus TaxID=1367881 RepID=A0A1H8IL40_9EURY|nr:hypothetical protein SAMN05216388_1004197 [Halorientalis persicus]
MDRETDFRLVTAIGFGLSVWVLASALRNRRTRR